MNDDDLDELEGNGYQNVENDPFARRSSHHTQRRSQMPGRSPKKPPSTGIPGAKGNPNAAAQSADGQNLQNKVKQGQESNSKSKNPFSKKKKKDKDKDKDSKEESTEEEKDTSDMIGDTVQSLPVGLKIKLVAVIAVVVGVIIGIMFLLAIIVEVLGLVGITVEIGGDFHQMMNPTEKTDENADHYDEMMAYYQELSNIELEYQQKCDMAVIDRNYLHGVLSYRYYAENNYEELPLKTVYSNMKGHARNAAELNGKKFPLKGHEFHYSSVAPKEEYAFSCTLERGFGISDGKDGMRYKNVFAAYTHLMPISSIEFFKEVL